MDGRLIVSTDEGLAEAEPRSGLVIQRMVLPGAGTLCAGHGALFCAADDGVVWRINPKRFVPEALFFGGPGVCGMCLGVDEESLYILCRDADSVMMCCAATGQPMLVNRAGVNPQEMTLSADGERLVVAGGEAESVFLYDLRTLRLEASMSMPGPVCSAATDGHAVCALCLCDARTCILAIDADDMKRQIRLNGLPGCVRMEEGCIYAAAGRELLRISLHGECLERIPLAARAHRMARFGSGHAMLNRAEEALYAHSGFRWRRIMRGVRDMAVLPCGQSAGDGRSDSRKKQSISSIQIDPDAL